MLLTLFIFLHLCFTLTRYIYQWRQSMYWSWMSGAVSNDAVATLGHFVCSITSCDSRSHLHLISQWKGWSIPPMLLSHLILRSGHWKTWLWAQNLLGVVWLLCQPCHPVCGCVFPCLIQRLSRIVILDECFNLKILELSDLAIHLKGILSHKINTLCNA